MDMHIEDITTALAALGLEIPAGTIRRWAAEGLIPAPLRVQNPVGRGRLSDWPDAAVEESACVWALRHLNTKVATPTVAVIRKVKELVPVVYDAPWELRVWGVARDGRRGIYLWSPELHPHLMLWVITREKARHRWPIIKPALVTMVWTREDAPEGARSARFEGVKLEYADENGLRIRQKGGTRSGLELLTDERDDYEKQTKLQK